MGESLHSRPHCQVPEEDIRAVHDYGTKTKDSILLPLGTEHERGGGSTAARGRSHSGDDSKSLEARQYFEAGADGISRGQVRCGSKETERLRMRPLLRHGIC